MSPPPEVAANTRKLISYSNKSGAASEECPLQRNPGIGWNPVAQFLKTVQLAAKVHAEIFVTAVNLATLSLSLSNYG
jgi:hypothetical protein